SDALRAAYRRALGRIRVFGSTLTSRAIVAELNHALPSILDVTSIVCSDEHHALDFEGLVVASLDGHPSLESIWGSLNDIGEDGYKIINHSTLSGAAQLAIVARTDRGALYGTFALLRRLGRGLPVSELQETSTPQVQLRMVNHWDNLDGTVERGFAGSSLWNWYQLPEVVSTRYTDYARASASIGINGVALTNVNANALILTKEYIHKVAAIAEVFRPYGIRVFLTARFSAPIQLGGLPTADPQEPNVKKWWQDKCDEIYRSIPDFGGFVVKANSEGQPGPQDYGRSH